VKETLDKMDTGYVLTAHDVELVTTAVFKTSLNDLVLKVHDFTNQNKNASPAVSTSKHTL